MTHYLVKKVTATSVLSILILSFSLTSCELPPDEEEEEGIIEDPLINSIKDLRIDPYNTLNSTYELDVDIDITHITKKRVYISICADFKPDQVADDTAYKDCFFKSSIVDGLKFVQLRLPLHITQIAATILFLEDNYPPLTLHYSQHSSSKKDWNIH